MKIDLNSVKKGMILKKAVYYGTKVLVEAGTKLDEVIIEKLRKFGVNLIEITENISEKEPIEVILEKEKEVRACFTKDYKQAINEAEDIVNKLSEGKVETEKVEMLVCETLKNVTTDSDIILSLLESTKDKSFIFQHTINSLVIAMVIGRALEYNDKQLEILGKGAFYHDIGMLKVGDEILLKKDKLTKEEKEKVKKHIDFSLEMAGNESKEVLDIIRYHHERMDGSGYPKGLQGQDIPEMAKVVAIADIYAALTGERNYRRRYDHYDAMKIVMQSSANLIDAVILKKFLKFMPIYPINSIVELNKNRFAKVVKANENPFRPVVDIEKEGKIERIDLMDENNRKEYIVGVKR